MTSPKAFRQSIEHTENGATTSAAIRVEIEKTRERLGETVEALGAQLNPTNLKRRVKESVREATIGKVQDMATNTKERIAETSRGLAQTIRENPLPAAMAAAGIGWLLLSRREQRPTAVRYTDGEPDEFAIPDESYREGGIREKVRDVAGNVAEKAQDLTEKAQDATQRAVEKVRNTGELSKIKLNETATVTQVQGFQFFYIPADDNCKNVMGYEFLYDRFADSRSTTGNDCNG